MRASSPAPAFVADAAPPFLDADPPPVVARSLASLLLVAFLLVTALGALIELPVTVAGTFTLVPVHGSDPLRAPRSGIVTEVAAVEGKRVARGEVLFVLRSELAGDRAAEVETLDISLRGADERLRNEQARARSQAEADRDGQRGLLRQASALTQQIASAERRLALGKTLLEHYQRLFAERLTSFEIVQEHALEVSRTEAEILRLRAEQEQARIAADRLGHEMEVRAQEIGELDRRVHEESELRRVRLATLRGARLSSESDEIGVSAPCDGTVTRLGVRAPAAVVSEGAVLGELVCAGEELRAEVAVVDEGMGLVKKGQSVKLYYDAFPYQRHGVRYAAVSFIGPGGSLKAEGPAFRVLADLGQADFDVRGAPYPLLPGMTGRAEIIVAKQSVLAYVFEPIRALGQQAERGP